MADSCWPLKLVNTLKGLIVFFSCLYILKVSTLKKKKKTHQENKAKQKK